MVKKLDLKNSLIGIEDSEEIIDILDNSKLTSEEKQIEAATGIETRGTVLGHIQPSF